MFAASHLKLIGTCNNSKNTFPAYISVLTLPNLWDAHELDDSEKIASALVLCSIDRWQSKNCIPLKLDSVSKPA